MHANARRLLGVVLIAAGLAAGCDAAAGPRIYQVIFPATGMVEAMPLTLTDHTRRIVGVRIEPAGAFPDGVANQGGGQDQLVVTWLGGMCDRAVSATVEPIGLDGLRLSLRTDRADGCLLAGITRALVLDLGESVAAERVEFVDLDAPPE